MQKEIEDKLSIDKIQQAVGTLPYLPNSNHFS